MANDTLFFTNTDKIDRLEALGADSSSIFTDWELLLNFIESNSQVKRVIIPTLSDLGTSETLSKSRFAWLFHKKIEGFFLDFLMTNLETNYLSLVLTYSAAEVKQTLPISPISNDFLIRFTVYENTVFGTSKSLDIEAIRQDFADFRPLIL